MSLAPGSRIGSYEVRSSIGAGGMGEVYLATDTRLHRDVALKIVSEIFEADREHLARFEREAQVLASLNHPNIAHICGLEQNDGVHALVMEFVSGRTLRGLLPAAGGGMPIRRVRIQPTSRAAARHARIARSSRVNSSDARAPAIACGATLIADLTLAIPALSAA